MGFSIAFQESQRLLWHTTPSNHSKEQHEFKLCSFVRSSLRFCFDTSDPAFWDNQFFINGELCVPWNALRWRPMALAKKIAFQLLCVASGDAWFCTRVFITAIDNKRLRTIAQGLWGMDDTTGVTIFNFQTMLCSTQLYSSQQLTTQAMATPWSGHSLCWIYMCGTFEDLTVLSWWSWLLKLIVYLWFLRREA